MADFHHGADERAWDHFSKTLGLTEDLLPVVSNPDAEISPLSTMQSKGKTPSMYNADRKVVGMTKWTDIVASQRAIDQWKAEADYGICVQTRRLRAIDIDVPDVEKSDLIRDLMVKQLGAMPIRWRSDSGKQLLVFRMDLDEPWPKRVVTVDGGIVEWLGDGQQFIAVGRHPDGERYKWGGDLVWRGLPKNPPVFEQEAVLEAFDELQRQFGTSEPRIARARSRGDLPDLPVHDELADWLAANWETHDVGPDGQLFIRCPFEDEHTSDSGPSSTAYFPAGTGGYQRGHFICLHAHCAGRDDRDFEDATGYLVAGFDDLSEQAAEAELPDLPEAGSTPAEPAAAEKPWPKLYRDDKGRPETSARNLVPSIAHPGMVKCQLAHDTFNDALMVAPEQGGQWRRFSDSDAIAIRIELEHRGFDRLGKELIRDCIAAAAHEQRMDSAIDWLGSLRWDGVSRVDTFARDIWGWEDTPYATAVSRYVWTALAGRVMQPGIRADMAPILVGLQGARKTTLIQMMVPDEEMYTEIRLDAKDDDLSRRLRGKLVAELEELRGLNSRALEEIKAFITRRKESWVPKFKEFENFFWRRCLFFGTTNEPEFLADPTGERRWLPGICGKIDVERMIEYRDQYWAEGAVMFAFEGLQWADAERLAKFEHAKYKIVDRTWTLRIEQWLGEDEGGFGPKPLDKGFITIAEALAALHIMPAQTNRGLEIRAEKVLLGIGFRRVVTDGGVVYER